MCASPSEILSREFEYQIRDIMKKETEVPVLYFVGSFWVKTLKNRVARFEALQEFAIGGFGTWPLLTRNLAQFTDILRKIDLKMG